MSILNTVAGMIGIYQRRQKQLEVAKQTAAGDEHGERTGKLEIWDETYPISKRLAEALVLDTEERLENDRKQLIYVMRRCLIDGELCERLDE